MVQMAQVLSNARTRYDEIMDKADPRVEDWFLMQSPLPSMLICLVYIYSIKIGSKVMKNREAYDIRNILITYNFAMVALSTYIFVEFLLSGWMTGYSLGCQPVDFSTSPQALRMARTCWLFYFSKFIELFDTFFFIVRKKFNQVSFLHVFHHGIMPVSWWFGVKFVPGGFGTFHALLNSFIHLVMYSYYGLAAMGPVMQKYLWWKKYMTKMQITQFILVMLHAAQLIFIECNYPIAFAYWIGAYAVIFLALFADFYRKAYNQNQKAKHSLNNATENGIKAKKN